MRELPRVVVNNLLKEPCNLGISVPAQSYKKPADGVTEQPQLITAFFAVPQGETDLEDPLLSCLERIAAMRERMPDWNSEPHSRPGTSPRLQYRD